MATQKEQQNYKPLMFAGFLSLVAIAVVIYLTLGETQQTVPKITLSYFKGSTEFAESIDKILQLEISQQKYFWLGFEPEKANEYDLVLKLKTEIEKANGPFEMIILDKELGLEPEEKILLGSDVKELRLKEQAGEVAELIRVNKDKKILVVTAAIYSTSLILQNPLAKVRELAQIRPMTFSMGYFPSTSQDEQRSIFKCDTDDKTGASPWGCAVLGKARNARRKLISGKV